MAYTLYNAAGEKIAHVYGKYSAPYIREGRCVEHTDLLIQAKCRQLGIKDYIPATCRVKENGKFVVYPVEYIAD